MPGGKFCSTMFAAMLALSLLGGAQDHAAADSTAHEIFKQLIEINTTDSAGNVTTAAEAMATRLRDAGFADPLVPTPLGGRDDARRPGAARVPRRRPHRRRNLDAARERRPDQSHATQSDAAVSPPTVRPSPRPPSARPSILPPAPAATPARRSSNRSGRLP